MGGGPHCPHPVTDTNVLLWEEQWFQGVLDRGLLCLEVSKSSFLDLSGRAEVSWLQRSPLLSPEAQESTVPKRLPLRPGSGVSLPCPCVPVCWSLLPAASSHTCCQLQRADPSPSPHHWHRGTQPLPGNCCCCGQRVGLIPGMLQDGDSTVPPDLDLCLPEVRPSSVVEEQTHEGHCS